MGVLFFKPIARKAIWGHTLVKNYFEYNDFPDGIGQSWSFSCQKDASNICLSEPYVGKSLLELWNNHQELFGHNGEDFPVIISLVAPEDDLSIQVHPDSDYAHKIGLKKGKNEAWYFIKTEENTTIVYGHNAKNQEDLYNYINNKNWDNLIRHLDVHTDDFVYLPAGLLHALRKGSIVYEIQQSTDITYRFYDYHRKDTNGNERPLQLKEAIECLSYNQEDMVNNITPVVKEMNNGLETIYISNDSFTVTKLDMNGSNNYVCNNYQLATVVKGSGYIDDKEIKVGDNFLIPKDTKVVLNGNMVIMMTTK